MEANGGAGLEHGGGHALANGEGHGLADHALANGEGHGLANGGDQAPAMEAGGALGNGGLNHELAPNGVVPAQAAAEADARGKRALRLAFLRLPAQEIARCRGVCRRWRDITGTDDFRRQHREHRYRTPMPLFFFQDPDLVRVNLRAVDFRDRVSRPVIRFARATGHEPFRVHGSCAGILLLSCGVRLYACNPCTRRWAAHLPPLHVDYDIVGFYATGDHHGEFRCQVLYRDREEPDCAYWLFTLAAAPVPRRRIGRPGSDDDELGGLLDRVLANGILPSYKIPPVFVANFLHWLPQAARDNSSVITFDTYVKSFALVPPPTVHVNGEDVPVVGGQLFGIGEHLAMTVISPARVDVWVRCNVAELWDRRYSIRLPVDVINLHEGYHQNGALTAGVFAVEQDRIGLVQCPQILLQCDRPGDVLESYQLAGHWTFLARHTIEESLLLHPSILPMTYRDAVDGDAPFFQNE